MTANGRPMDNNGGSDSMDTQSARRETVWANALLVGDVIDVAASGAMSSNVINPEAEGYVSVRTVEHGEWLMTGHRYVYVNSGQTHWLSVPVTLDSHDKVTILSRDANFAPFPVIADEAMEYGCDSVDSYARQIGLEADEYVSVEDMESASFVGELTDLDKLTFSFLDTLGQSRDYVWREGYAYKVDAVWMFDGGGWEDANYAIVNVTSNGVVFLTTYTTEDEYEAAVEGWREWEADHFADENADEDADVAVSNPYDGPGGLLDEVRQAERIIGTE